MNQNLKTSLLSKYYYYKPKKLIGGFEFIGANHVTDLRTIIDDLKTGDDKGLQRRAFTDLKGLQNDIVEVAKSHLINIESEKVKSHRDVDLAYLLDNKVIPGQCPESGLSYFYSVTLDDCIALDMPRYKRILRLNGREVPWERLTLFKTLKMDPNAEKSGREGDKIIDKDLKTLVFMS